MTEDEYNIEKYVTVFALSSLHILSRQVCSKLESYSLKLAFNVIDDLV